tara:strand:+ start:746 stop:874 length:129 start_codon:yes stop_codon:yes gene_type:complete
VDELSPEQAYHCEYFGMMRRNKEEESKFKALGEMLSKLLGGK